MTSVSGYRSTAARQKRGTSEAETFGYAQLTLELRFTRATIVERFPGSALHGLVAGSVLSYAHELPWPWPSADAARTVAAMKRIELAQPGSRQFRPYVLACKEWGTAQRYAPGESYAFDLFLIGEAATWWRAICVAIARRGQDAHALGTFAGNFELVVQDAKRAALLDVNDALHEPECFTEDDIRRRAASLAAASRWSLTLTAPLVLEDKGRGVLTPAQLSAEHLYIALETRVNKLGAGRLLPAVQPGFDSITKELSQPQLQFEQTRVQDKAERLWLRGVEGKITLTDDWRPWLPALVICEALGLGVNTTFGKGRFTLSALVSDSAPFTLASLANIDLLTAARNLGDADDLTDSDADDDDVARLYTEITERRYCPGPLRSLNLPKAHGGVRELAIPAPRDMIVQRALVMLLRPVIESKLEESSFAFRKGHSRYQAATAVEKLRQAGFSFFFRADIDRFFDAVQHPLLEKMLQELHLPPDVVAMIMACVKADLTIAGRAIPRQQGLPQGAPLSPLLANLYLDGFDEALQCADYRLIRFADDFLIAAKSEAEAREAGRKAAEILHGLGLVLDIDKTSVVSFDQGFTFLGFVFSRSLVLEQRHQAPRPSRLREVNEADSSLVLQSGVETDPLLRAVHVEGFENRLCNEMDRLVIRRDGHEVVRVPFSWIGEISIGGSAQLSSGVIQRALDLNIPIWFVGRNGALQGKLARTESDPSELWQRQQALLQTPEIAVPAARTLLRGKLLNQAAILRRYTDVEAAVSATEMLRGLGEQVYDATSLPALIGLESRAAAIYFGAWLSLIPEEYGFRSRQQRPARDPVNVLLNLGYTRLRTQIRGLVERHGLSPFHGFVHQSRALDTGAKRHDTLVSDLMEPFRPLVDRAVLSLLRKQQIQPKDFSYFEKAEQPCLMSAPARVVFYEKWEQVCRAPATYQHKTLTLLRVMDHLIYDTREWIRSGCAGGLKVYQLK